MSSKQIDKSKIPPFEAVGVICAQSIGEPGTQMCISADERIILKQEGAIRIVSIGAFTDSMINQVGCRKVQGYEFADTKEEIYVLALCDNEKLEWKRLLSCNRHATPEKLIKIKTASGRQITATHFHSFVTRKNNRILAVSGKELRKGDRIPSIKYLPENCICSVPTVNMLPCEVHPKLISSQSGITTARSGSSLPRQFGLDSSFGWFIGAYLSEGCLCNREVCLSNTEENFLARARFFIGNLGINYREISHNRGFGKSNDLKIRSSLLHDLIGNICGTGDSKHVPAFAYSAEAEFVAHLLRGYFDGDGNVTVKKKMIRASSNSEELLDGIKLLLVRFGIFAHKVKDKQFGLIIPYKYAPAFLAKIGSDIQYKHADLEKLATSAEKFIQSKSQDYTDMISGFDDVLYLSAKKLRYPTRRVNNFTKRQKIGRTTLLRYIGHFEQLANEKGVDIREELSLMKTMAYSDVVWDEIAELKSVVPSGRYVYDLSVEDAHTFATFDGIITHNTMRTFHYAGVAEHVPTGLPRLIELVDAKKEPKKPIIDVYLKSAASKSRTEAEKVAREISSVFVSDVSSVNDNLEDLTITVILNERDAKSLGITTATMKKVLEEFTTNIKIIDNRFVMQPAKDVQKDPKTGEKKTVTAKHVRKMSNKVKDAIVKGIRGIYKAVVLKSESEYFIRAGGYNILGAMTHSMVDPKRVYTNNVKEIERVFGVEAARNSIIKEVKDVLEMQNLNVDVRHIMLLADAMTCSGNVKSIGRHGLSGEKVGVLGRAAFEETVKHLVNASASAEEENLVGVTENIIVGQTVPVGTGKVKLVMKAKK